MLFKFSIICLLFLTLFNCTHIISDETGKSEISIQAVVYSDSLNYISILSDQEDSFNWTLEYRHKKLNYTFQALTWNNLNSETQFYLNDLFGWYNSNLGIHREYFYLENIPLISNGDTLELYLNNGLIKNSTKSIVKEKIQIKSFLIDEKNKRLKVEATFPKGNYAYSFKLHYHANSSKSANQLYVENEVSVLIEDQIELDSKAELFLDFHLGDDAVKRFIENIDGYPNSILFAESYTIEYQTLLSLITERDHIGEPSRLYDYLSDDISKYRNLPSNVKPFNGYFTVISRSHLRKKVDVN